MRDLKLTYFGGVSDGILKMPKEFREQVKVFEGKRVEVTVKRVKKNRSNEQNSYYWGVVIPVVMSGLRDIGYDGLTSSEVHDFLKNKFAINGREIINPNTGEVAKINKTTTTMSTTEMMDYIEQVTRFAAEWLNIEIPSPMPIMPL